MQGVEALQGTSSNWVMILLLVLAGIFAFSIVVILLVLRHLKADRQLTHSERMKSLEVGIPWEATDPTEAQSEYMDNAFWVSFWMTVTVPIAAFWGAATATGKTNGEFGIGFIIWFSAAAASVVAVICATVLMINSRTRRLDNTKSTEKPYS